jgi:WD40 repeat protein
VTTSQDFKGSTDNRLLHEILVKHFDKDELRALCLDLKVDYDSLPGENKTSKAAELIRQLDQHNRIPELVGLVKQRRPDISWDDATLARYFFVPFFNTNLVGRESELERLHQALTDKSDPRPVVGLGGVQGIGTTRLAIEYARRYQRYYPDGVFWNNAAESLSRLGKRLRPALACHSQEKQVHAFVVYVQKYPNALLILDDLDDLSVLKRPIDRKSTLADLGCKILFTTHRQDLDGFRSIRLADQLPEAAALRLLLRSNGRESTGGPVHQQRQEARILCAALGYLSFALNMAGAQLERQFDLTLKDYRQQLRKYGAMPPPEDEREWRRLSDLSVRHEAAATAVLRYAWATLEPDAKKLLRVAGQLPQGAIIPAARLELLAGAAQFASLAPARRKLEQNALVEDLRCNHVWLHPLTHRFAAARGRKASPNLCQRCVANLLNAYEDIAILQDQAVQRNVDALREDLASAREMLRKAPGAPKDLAKRLRDLYELLSDVPPLPQARPEEGVSFLKQIRSRAVQKGLDGLAERISKRLKQLGQHSLKRLWFTVREPYLERDLGGHSSITRAVAVTADSCCAVSAADDSKLKVWDLIEGQEKRTLYGHESGVRAVAVTRDGHWAISASNDRMLKVWDLETGECMLSLQGHDGWVLAVALTPDERRAVSASKDGTLKVWDLETGTEKMTIPAHARAVSAVAVTPDGRRIISASYDRVLKVWDLETGLRERTLYGHGAAVSAVAVTRDGRRAVSASFDRTLRVWDIETGQSSPPLEGHEGRVNGVAITPDGDWAISACSDRTLKVWNLETLCPVRTLRGHKKDVMSVTVTPDGRWALSTSRDRTLKVWDWQTKRFPQGHDAKVIFTAAVPESHRAFSASRDGVFKVWESQDGNELASLNLGVELQSAAVSPNGEAILGGDEHGNVHRLRYNEPIFDAVP